MFHNSVRVRTGIPRHGLPMHVQLKQPDSLSQSELVVWHQIVRSNAEFSSPYFHPQFTLDVAAVRNDVEVAVCYDDERPVGFFPFQRSGRTARPVGGMLSDAHGLIHDGTMNFSWPELLASINLAAWSFHYQIASQIPAIEWHPDVTTAAVMNLKGGFEQYAARLDSKTIVKQTDRKSRKLERECGPLRFEWDSTDERAFELLLQWKSQQYHDSDIADVFEFDWTVNLLRRIWQYSDADYEGLLSVLYVDEQPAAVHFGLRAGNVLHQWFPAYDPELQRYSPGVIHLLDMARHASDHGVERIDLGRVCQYKSRVATDLVDVAEGSVDLRPVSRLLKTGCAETVAWLKRSPLYGVARVPGRILRRMVEQRQFQ